MKCFRCRLIHARFIVFCVPLCYSCYKDWIEYKEDRHTDVDSFIHRRHYENGTSEAVAELHDLIRQVEKGEK